MDKRFRDHIKHRWSKLGYFLFLIGIIKVKFISVVGTTDSYERKSTMVWYNPLTYLFLIPIFIWVMIVGAFAAAGEWISELKYDSKQVIIKSDE